MTNSDAWEKIEQWAEQNMPKRPGPDFSNILRGAGGAPGEFTAFMPRRTPHRK